MRWAGDPGVKVTPWLWDGAPAGVARDFDLDGLLLPVGLEDTISFEELGEDPNDFTNYAGVETDPKAVQILNDYLGYNWMREFSTWDGLKAFGEGDPILNKLVCLLKIKEDGSEKRRIFIDAKVLPYPRRVESSIVKSCLARLTL